MMKTLDVSQLRCPRSLIEVKLALRSLQTGSTLEVTGANQQLYEDLQKIQQQWGLDIQFKPPSDLIITI